MKKINISKRSVIIILVIALGIYLSQVDVDNVINYLSKIFNN